MIEVTKEEISLGITGCKPNEYSCSCCEGASFNECGLFENKLVNKFLNIGKLKFKLSSTKYIRKLA